MGLLWPAMYFHTTGIAVVTDHGNKTFIQLSINLPSVALTETVQASVRYIAKQFNNVSPYCYELYEASI